MTSGGLGPQAIAATFLVLILSGCGGEKEVEAFSAYAGNDPGNGNVHLLLRGSRATLTTYGYSRGRFWSLVEEGKFDPASGGLTIDGNPPRALRVRFSSKIEMQVEGSGIEGAWKLRRTDSFDSGAESFRRLFERGQPPR